MDWLIANYQLVAAGLSGVFGAGAVIGSIRGRIKGVEKQLTDLDGRVDGLYEKTGKIQEAVERLASRPSSNGGLWRRN